MKVSVVVGLQVEGLHKWEGCDIEKVSFLRNLHRHIFYVKCKKEVSHKDRDIEIICLKRRISAYLNERYGSPCMFSNMSCEMIAQDLLDTFALNYCQVLEDNENGAEVER